MMKKLSDQFDIPESVAAEIGQGEIRKIRCDVHGWQFGDICHVCELDRERSERSMFAKCEVMGLAPMYHCQRLSDYRTTDHPGQLKAIEAARAFLARDYRVLVLRGSEKSEGYGTGKTTLAASILYERMLQDGTTGIYTTADRLLTCLKDSIDAGSGKTQQLKDKFIRTRLLVLDEILAEPMSAWARKTISDILAERIDYGRQTVLASNKCSKAIAGILHPRTLDRLRACSVGAAFDWPSLRGAE